MPAAPRLIFCLPTPRLVHQASLDLQLQKLPPHLNRPPNKSRALKMFCLRARAVPSTFRATTSAMRTPMNRYAKQPTTFPVSKPTRQANTLLLPETDSLKSPNNQAHPPQCSHPDPSPPSSPRQPASNPRGHSVPACPRQSQPQPPPPSHPYPHFSPRRLPRSPARSPQVLP